MVIEAAMTAVDAGRYVKCFNVFLYLSHLQCCNYVFHYRNISINVTQSNILTISGVACFVAFPFSYMFKIT